MKDPEITPVTAYLAKDNTLHHTREQAMMHNLRTPILNILFTWLTESEPMRELKLGSEAGKIAEDLLTFLSENQQHALLLKRYLTNKLDDETRNGVEEV